MKLSKKALGFLLLLSVLLVGFVMTDCSEAAKKKRFKFTRITNIEDYDYSNVFWAMMSGNGKKILYSHRNEENSFGLFLVNADGTNSKKLIDNTPSLVPVFISYDGENVVFYYSNVDRERLYFLNNTSTGVTTDIKPCISDSRIDSTQCYTILERNYTFSGDGNYLFLTNSLWDCQAVEGAYGNWYWSCDYGADSKIYKMSTDDPTNGNSLIEWLDTDTIDLPDYNPSIDTVNPRLYADKEGKTLAIYMDYLPEGYQTNNDDVAVFYFTQGEGKEINKIFIDSDTLHSNKILTSPDREWIIYQAVDDTYSTGSKVTVSRVVGGSGDYNFKLPKGYSDIVGVSEDASWILCSMGTSARDGGLYLIERDGSHYTRVEFDKEKLDKTREQYIIDTSSSSSSLSYDGKSMVFAMTTKELGEQLYVATMIEGDTTPEPTPSPSPSPTPLYTVVENKRTYEQLKVGDPVDAGSGAYSFSLPMLRPGGPMGLNFTVTYRSDNENWQTRTPNDFPGIPSRFWWSTRSKLYIGDDERLVWTEDGGMVSFNADGSLNETPAKSNPDNGQPTPYVMKDTTDYVYVMNPVKENVYIFQKGGTETAQGRILYVMDRNDNYLKFTYENEGHNNPSKIEDNTGRQLTFSYSDHDSTTEEAWFLDSVTDQAGRVVSFSYEDNASDNGSGWALRSVTDPLDATTTFQYSTVSGNKKLFGDNITQVTYPEGNTPYTNTYKATKVGKTTTARVTSQTDAYNNTTHLTYKQGSKDTVKTTAEYADGSKDIYVHYSDHSPPKELTDAAGKTATFEKNDHEQITSVTDRMGDTATFDYHTESGKLASVTNARGDTVSYTYTAQDQGFTHPDTGETVTFTFYNLTRIDYPDGTNEQFTYDSKGNVSQRTDQTGNTWQYEYNDIGQITKITNPAGGVLDSTYNDDATMASSKDSDTGTTTYEYDAYKRLSKITHPDASTVQITYDLADRVSSLTDENGNAYAYTYDTNGNLIKVTDPAGKETQYAYDLMDRVTQVTDRLDKQSALSYNSMRQLESVTDPTGVTTGFGYNTRRWLNRTTIGEKTWQTDYDDEGVVSSRKTPLGYKTSFQTDKLGHTTAITDPLDKTTAFTRDAMSRITEETDPLGNTTAYTYDSRGLLSGVTMPVIGTSAYGRNQQGLLSQITDLNGQNWSFAYTSTGRPESQTDPLDRTWQFAYDSRGRLSTATYPDGGTQTATYDSAGNITRTLFTDGTDLQYTYDTLNRLTSANDITFTYDAEGRVTKTTDAGVSFGASYDDAGRLKTVGYHNDAFTVTYSYSSDTGLLARVTDGLTGTQIDFTYDNDLRLTNITRSNGVNAAFTWDNASRLTRIRDGDVLDLQYTLDAAGQVRKATMDVPLEPSGSLSEDTKTFTYDAACQVSADGYTYDQRGQLTGSPESSLVWDGASRLIEIGGAGLTYNGLGDLRTRNEGDTATHYYYNYAIGMKPIVAEQDATTNQFQRYYVWTPGGQLLYMIDAADGNKVSFYHFDRTGSTLALTDSTGAVTDSYAYTPYGKLLQHNGTNQQPFTFVGQFGVRQEGTNGIYHMRARYYDGVTVRFISREPLWPQTADPKMLNPYQYVGENPVGMVDPSGLLIGGYVPYVPRYGGRGESGEIFDEHIGTIEPYEAPPGSYWEAGGTVAGESEAIVWRLRKVPTQQLTDQPEVEEERMKSQRKYLAGELYEVWRPRDGGPDRIGQETVLGNRKINLKSPRMTAQPTMQSKAWEMFLTGSVFEEFGGVP